MRSWKPSVLAAAVVVALWAPLVFGRGGGGESYSGGGSDGAGTGDFFYDLGALTGRAATGQRGDFDALVFQAIARHPVAGTLALLLLAAAVLKVGSMGNDHYAARTIARGAEAQSVLARAQGLSRLKARDPAFDPDAFVGRAEQAFMKIQQAWSAQDMKPARAFVSDGVMERFSIQIAMQVLDGKRNEVSNVSSLSTEILQLESDAHFDTLHARIEASATDRDVSLDDGTVLRGWNDPVRFAEVWSFLRRPGVKTLGKPGLIEGFCPNCGSPLEIADAAKCGSCMSWVNSGEYDWVLAEITQECEWSLRESESIPGLEILIEDDPALNRQFLEDRASAAFWRWQLARMRRDPAPLAPVATTEFLAKVGAEMEEQGSFCRNAAVGSVAVLAMEPGEERDRAHVGIRWSGLRYVYQDGRAVEKDQAVMMHVFLLARKASVRTDARAGLTSLRCAGCGAPPAKGETAGCEYCGTAFNDGSRHWVVEDIVPVALWSMPAVPEREIPAPVDADWAREFSPVDALTVMVSGMLADGEASSAEVEYVRGYARKRGIPDEKVEVVWAAARAGQIEVPTPRSAEEAKAALRGLIAMALVNGIVTDGEMKALAAYGARVSLGEGQVRAMVKEERLALYRKAKEAIAASKAATV